MERSTFALVFFLVFLTAVFYLQTRIYHEGFMAAHEGFFGSTSPGTMVQLQTSHVPTEADIAGLLREKKRAEAEAQKMTSGFIDIHGAPY